MWWQVKETKMNKRKNDPRKPRDRKFGPDALSEAFRAMEESERQRKLTETRQIEELLEAQRKAATFVPDRVTRDFDKLTLETMGFTIRLGEENVDCYLPVDQFVSKMPAEDKRLLERDPNSFTSRYSQVMIATARDRHQKKALGSSDDLDEHFDHNKYTKAQARVLKELRAEIRG